MNDVVLVFCPNTTCQNACLEFEWTAYCWECGGEMLPSPQCLCGKNVMVKLVVARLNRAVKTFCTGCGKEWTEARVGELLSHNLHQQLKEVQEAADALRN